MGFFKNYGNAMKRQLTLLSLKYLGGHPECPSLVIAILERKGDALTISESYFEKDKPAITIPLADIINVSLEKADKRSLGKAATGAVIGGVLTGGIGALAGAAIGGRSKDKSVIVLTIKYGPATVDVLFGGDDVSKKYGQFVALLK